MHRITEQPTGEALGVDPIGGRVACVPPVSRVPTQGNPRTSRRLRILHVFNYLGLGGTELTALRMISHLDPSQFENLVCGVRGFDPKVAKERYPGGIEVIVASRESKSRSQVSSLVEVIKRHKPDVVHSRNWGTIESVPAAWFARVPVVIHSEHGYEVETLTRLSTHRRVLRRAVYAMADSIFTVTGQLREFHAKQAWISPERIQVIRNGINTEKFAPRPDLKKNLREKLRIPAERFVIGSVGRIVPIKDHGAMLKAAELLIGRGLDLHVVLVGSGPELVRHQGYAKQSSELSERVTFMEATENVVEALSVMDVFVLPSLSEGMSNTLLEAMSCGLAVVASRVGGNPEVVEEKRSGLLFTAGVAAGLADCVWRLAADGALRKQLGEAARERILQKFSLQRMVDDYSRLYWDLGVKAGVVTRRAT